MLTQEMRAAWPWKTPLAVIVVGVALVAARLSVAFCAAPSEPKFNPSDFEHLKLDGLGLRMTQSSVLKVLGKPSRKQIETFPALSGYKQESWRWGRTSVGFQPVGRALVVSWLHGSRLIKGGQLVLCSGERASEIRPRLENFRWQVEQGQHVVCQFPFTTQVPDENLQTISNGGPNRIRIFYKNGLVDSVFLYDAELETYR